MNHVDFAFLDSGTGGIPYMLELKKESPESSCLYLGDTAHFPYGEKSYEEIIRCSSESVKKMIDSWKPSVVIIACNTISVTALDDIRKRFPDTPIVGTVPAIKLASSVSKNRRIGFLATNAAVNHPYSKKLIESFAKDCEVFSRGDPDLVAFIERNLFTATEDEKIKAVKPAVGFFLEKDCDTVIMGCTHFCHISRIIEKASGYRLTSVDSREGVCHQAIRVKPGKKEGECISSLPEDMTFFVTSLKNEEENEYVRLCKNYDIPWGGVLKN